MRNEGTCVRTSSDTAVRALCRMAEHVFLLQVINLSRDKMLFMFWKAVLAWQIRLLISLYRPSALLLIQDNETYETV